jgi:hypothetical protein
MKSLRDHCPVTGLPITQKPARIDTAIIFGMKTAIKVAVKIARRFNVFPFQIETANDYISALKKACDLLSDRQDIFGEPRQGSPSSSLSIQGNHKSSDQAFADPSWQFQSDNFSLHYEVIERNILHGINQGLLKTEYISPSFQLMEKTVRFIQNFSNPSN